MIKMLANNIFRKVGKFICRIAPKSPFVDVHFKTTDNRRILIRQLRPGDESFLAEFRERLSNEAKQNFEGHRWDLAALRRIIHSASAMDDLRILAVDNTGRIIGYAFLQDYWSFPILGIAVEDAFQGQGLGAFLLKSLISKARSDSKPGIKLTVVQSNRNAIDLYEKYGFKLDGEFMDENTGLNYNKMYLSLKGE